MTDRRFAFLRAVNTGRRRLTNDQLLAPFRDLGLQDVAAYQAAGNVTFLSDVDPTGLEARIGRALASTYGFDAPVFVRTRAELRDAVAAVPFTAEQIAATHGRTQITFLASAPSGDDVAAALAVVPDEDLVAFTDRHWWWLPRVGVGDSRLAVSRIESIVGPMTMRTLGTVERMLARFGDEP